MFGLIASFQPLRKMCGNRTTWLKEAPAAGNQLFFASVNLVKAARLPLYLTEQVLTLYSLSSLQPPGEMSVVTVSILPMKKRVQSWSATCHG